MMKKLTYVVLATLMMVSCHEEKFKTMDLPSKELIDSVISSVIRSNSIRIRVVGYSKQQIDSLREKGVFIPVFYNLYDQLLEWKNPREDNNFVELKRRNDIKVFQFDKLRMHLENSETKNYFNSEDSSFIDFQIQNRYFETIRIKNISHLFYTNRKEIDSIQNQKNLKFKYCQFSRPLFNKAKTKVIVGLSLFHINHPTYIDGGNLMILKRKGNDWILVNEIGWWGE